MSSDCKLGMYRLADDLEEGKEGLLFVNKK
jgi:hypothetical protein